MKHRAGDFRYMDGRARIYRGSQESERGKAPVRKSVKSPHKNSGGQRMPTAVTNKGTILWRLRKSTGQSLTRLPISPGASSAGHHGPAKLGVHGEQEYLRNLPVGPHSAYFTPENEETLVLILLNPSISISINSLKKTKFIQSTISHFLHAIWEAYKQHGIRKCN